MSEVGDSLKKIRALLDLMRENELAELELEEEGFRVALRKPVPPPPIPPSFLPAAPAVSAVPHTRPADPVPEADAGLDSIKSPIVGTFYRSPSPEAAPFVGEGETVHKGAVVCIIEAMKIMNEVKSELDGRIERVLVESGEPVEYGQPLFLVRRA